MSRYYDRQGKPMTMEDRSSKFEQNDYKIVAQDKVNGYRVSTVWLGLDHNFVGGEPLIFETMIFPADSRGDLYMDRYSNEEDALKGHKKAVKIAKKGIFE